MPWSLEIHHIDIGTNGDSTLIVARLPLFGGNIVRSVLIDAGKSSNAETVHQYITETAGLDRIDVIVSTHYDVDHFTGVAELLKMDGTQVYDHAILYDQGQPSFLYNRTNYYRENVTGPLDARVHKPASNYLKYIDAINKKPGTRRATLRVNSFDLVRYDADGASTPPPADLAIPGPAYVNGRYYNGIPDPASDDGGRLGAEGNIVGSVALPPYWLLGKEIMWGDGMDGKGGNPDFGQVNLGVDLAGAPTLTCISTNKWTLQAGDTRSYVSDVGIYETQDTRFDNVVIADMENGHTSEGGGNANDNPKSLGFLLKFNDFTYYIAGDLESLQEDGAFNPNEVDQDADVDPDGGQPLVFYNGVRQFLNPDREVTGRISAMHASHHGSATANSADFINQLFPSATFISCSNGNQFFHPDQAVVNHLDGYPSDPINAAEFIANQHPPRPPVSDWTSKTHYLTGFQNPHFDVAYAGADGIPFSERTFGGDASFTAGQLVAGVGGGDYADGHIVLRVSDANSNSPQDGLLYRALKESVDDLNDFFSLGMDPTAGDSIGNIGAMAGGYAAVGVLGEVHMDAISHALDTAAWMGSYKYEDNSGEQEVIRTTSLVDIANGGGDEDQAVQAIKDHEITGSEDDGDLDLGRLQFTPNGTAEAVGYAVKGQSALLTAAKIMTQSTEASPIPQAAANAAGKVGKLLFDKFGYLHAGIGAAAAMGAAMSPDNPSNEGQAILMGAFLGAAVNCTAVQMAELLYNASILSGGSEEFATLAGTVGAICIAWGDPNASRDAMERLLRMYGHSAVVAAAKSASIRDKFDRTRMPGLFSNEMFTVTFHDDNPNYTGGGGVNPRTISHIN